MLSHGLQVAALSDYGNRKDGAELGCIIDQKSITLWDLAPISC